ncbi:uncharacterized protein F54H12.2-like [Culicoides brevitarsis]|uniref:uncharacterized protein F54H12.2-like n=1 Tax=Culicoides brevitarsis TaxID=469753 RepID=UPI00307B7F4B
MEPECMNSSLDLFQRPPLQTNILKTINVSYNPLTSLDNSNTIEFHIPSNGDYYKDLGSLNLRLLLQIQDNAQPAGNPPVNPPTSLVVNNILHSLFRQCQVTLNGTHVSQDDTNYHYKCYLQTVLNYGLDARKTQLSAQAYHPDENDVNSTSDNHNAGIKDRRRLFGQYGGYKKVELVGKIHSDIFNIDRFLPSGIDLRVSLIKEKENFYMMGENSTGSIKILEANLTLDHKVINPEILAAHHYTLNSRNMIIPFTRTSVKQFTINSGLSSVSLDNVIMGKLPNSLVFGMVSHAAYNGSRTENPFNFSHFRLQNFSLYVNGEQTPTKPLSFSFGDEGNICTQGYVSLFKALGLWREDRGHQITRSKFENGYFLLAFDLTADHNFTDSCGNMTQEGTIRLEFKFDDPLTAPITCLVYSESDACMEIDRNKNVFISQ